MFANGKILSRRTLLAIFALSHLGNPTFALNVRDSEAQKFAEHLIAETILLPNDLNTRIEFVSRAFLGLPYLIGPLGEGEQGYYDQDPLYRFDGFDCTTFIETTFALSQAQNYADFFSRLLRVRYDQGQISFLNRNHFVELDWNPHNIGAGFFADRSEEIGAASDRATAVQTFSKHEWYAHLPASKVKIPGASGDEIEGKLTELHHAGDNLSDVTSNLAYLKKSSLLELKNSLPTPAVLNIVHALPVPGTTQTKTEVTHQVLLLKVNGTLHIRAASSVNTVMRVIDTTFENYVETLIKSPTTLGINVLEILKTPLYSHRQMISPNRKLKNKGRV